MEVTAPAIYRYYPSRDDLVTDLIVEAFTSLADALKATVDGQAPGDLAGRLMMAIGGLFVPEARESLEMMYEFEKPFVVDDSRFTRAFGDHATSHRQAVRETIAWYRKMGG